MPQRSVLGPTIFIIYLNGLESGLLSKASKFADDTKLCAKGLRVDDCRKNQEDLNKLSDWSEKWQMSFNVEKCKVMHIGDENPHFKYQIRNQELGNVKKKRKINQSWGAYTGGRVASPTPRRHPWRLRLASLHAGFFCILSDSQQKASTCRSQELCGRPRGLLQAELSFSEATR